MLRPCRTTPFIDCISDINLRITPQNHAVAVAEIVDFLSSNIPYTTIKLIMSQEG